MIGGPKGRYGWIWGLFLGWLGVIIVALLPPHKSVLPAPAPAYATEPRNDGAARLKQLGFATQAC